MSGEIHNHRVLKALAELSVAAPDSVLADILTDFIGATGNDDVAAAVEHWRELRAASERTAAADCK